MAVEEGVRNRIHQLVIQTGYTQGEFARRIGLDPSKLSRALAGKRRFLLTELTQIAEVGGAPIEWLLNGDGAEPANPARTAKTTAASPVNDGPAGARDKRRGEILAAAWRLIAKRGYHAVRVADIARACGTSSAAVHYYFPGKQDVLNEALRFCVEQAFARQTTELRKIEDGHERLLKLIDMQLPRAGQLRDEWCIWLQFWSEAALHTELRAVHNDFYARWRETVVRIISRGQRQGRFRADVDPQEAALRFTALTDGAAIQVLTGAHGMTIERMRQLLTDFVHRELCP
jgi:AcrR family transcriptional regulator